ncbi:MAG: T9SS type A sorting domain-containing protein [Flavobacteriia bacterium]|nr:T9SS type A sorting domain-containing protein [Flavobacteriia bacterium]
MKLLLLLLALPIIGFGQNVNIPNGIFKAYLVNNTAINTNGDNEIQVSEASVFNGSIILAGEPGGSFGGLNITDLTGIEAFVSLTHLNCFDNLLTNLDVSACIALTTLDCSLNSALTSLDVSGCTALTYLNCGGNALTNLDVSACIALTILYCGGNAFTSLDVSTCSALTSLHCSYSLLTSLDVKNGNNINMVTFNASYNPNLSCIEVDNVAWSQENWANNIDSTAYFSLNCSGAGISDINESYSLMLYPNPTNGEFTITGLELLGTVSSLTLTDMNGKVVKVLDTKAIKFSMASIKPGVYFLNIISGNKQEVLKIVKE